jgi:hypothetical protein
MPMRARPPQNSFVSDISGARLMVVDKKVSEEQRRQMIAEAAYFRAERRGFGVDPMADWIEAEREVSERMREIENAQLLERFENGLVAASERVAALKKRLRRAASGARAEWHGDVEKLGELRDALRATVKELRAQGEHAGQRARQQAEKIWDEMSATMQRVSTRMQH